MLPIVKSTRLKPYVAIVLALVILFVLLARLQPVRVGDGSEYYALYYAWELTHRPWMIAPAYEAYGQLVQSGAIRDMVPADALANWFTALRVGPTSDFNHFWFYSLLAALCGKLAALVGLQLGAHGSFLALHAVLAAVSLGLAYRHFGGRGLLAAVVMLLASPMFWFVDKVHTEFMTVCLVLSAVILVMVERYLAAALFIALASTQNPSFALVACIPLFYRVVLQRERRYSLFEVAMAVAVVVAVLAHPVYYFARYGVVTPQLLAGGAALGGNIWTFYVWIVDPDLGLLPNWPLGLLVLLAALVAYLRKPVSLAGPGTWRVTAFVLACCAINFFAHSSTTNLNSGATPGLARYALWYLPLAFPVFLWVFGHFALRSKRTLAAGVVLVLLTIVSMGVNNPRRHERYATPSMLSELIQTKLPFLYSPPAEVFLERYSGVGEAVYGKNVRALLGPDCRKILLLPGAGRHGALAPTECMMDAARLDAFAASPAFEALMAGTGGETTYARISAEQADSLRMRVAPGPHGMGQGGDGAVFLGSGWNQPESWGVWSEGTQPALLLPCNEQQYFKPEHKFTLALALRPFGRQEVTIIGSGGTLWEGTLEGAEQVVRFAVPPENCRAGRYKIRLKLPGAASPASLGLSGDSRQLGVGLASLEITAG